MPNQEFKQRQISAQIMVLVTGLVTLFIFSTLLWDHFHGGVPSHHILHQKELPAISNWWSGLLLPALTWFLLVRINKRLRKQAPSTQKPEDLKKWAFFLFAIGLTFAVLISISFVNDFSIVLSYVPHALILLSLIIPIFYSEFILGFVLGMTFTFGAILPTVFILVIAFFGFLTYRFIRPFILKYIGKIGSRFAQ